MAISKRDHLVDTALNLFYENGFHATGIDTILREAGVAKMTLYNHFKSKDELIVAALDLRDTRFREWFVARVEAMADTPRDKLLAMFDALEEWFETDAFNGCIFINAAAEYGKCDDPVHESAALHKRLVFDYIVDVAKASGTIDPRGLAQQLLLLQEGAIVVAHVLDAPIAARQAKRAAEALIDHSLGS
ncbi:MAG: TetR/AcrR family transcriptional regulator [Proteobacteria bacterium]|nr:TetR/AcrR family transcriptional regulator [Pseudomonadota bacterium]